MKRYILRRLLEMIPTTIGVLMLTFVLFYVIGGSPATVILGQHASQEAIASYDARFGYDKPLFFGNWYTVDATTQPVEGKPADLAFSLTEGTYRFNPADAVTEATLEEILGDERETIKPEGGAFTVPSGWKLTAITSAAPADTQLSVSRRAAHFFDSQFVHYISGLIRLDFGESREYDMPVLDVLKTGVGPTFSLTFPILVSGAVVGVLLALLCATNRGGWIDRSVLVGSTILMSVNYVVWILMGQFVLGYKWGWFPLWGYESGFYLVLPVIIGVMSSLGSDVRFYRAAILDEVYKPYVRTARAKGLSNSRVMFRHILRNSLIPIVTYISLSIPFLFTGSLLLESFFGIPGLGSVSLNAIHSSDMTVVRGVVVIGALLYQFVNLLTDICYGWLDPRVRLS